MKLDPRVMFRNPVMFTVEMGTVVMFVRHHRPAHASPMPRRAASATTLTVFIVLFLTLAIRQLRRGHCRGAGQGPGRIAAQNPPGHTRQACASPTAR
ncbi:MAG: hypothetical protein WKG07_49305 [Hymenobacter sp.]